MLLVTNNFLSFTSYGLFFFFIIFFIIFYFSQVGEWGLAKRWLGPHFVKDSRKSQKMGGLLGSWEYFLSSFDQLKNT